MLGTALRQPVKPEPGLCVDAICDRERDADTIEAHVPGSAYVFALRLIDTWSPETDDKDVNDRRIAREGKAFVHAKCVGQSIRVYIPFTGGSREPLKALTFDRVPAWVWVEGDRDSLNKIVVERGFASTTKAGKLGE